MRTNTGRAAGALAVLSIIWGYNWVVMKQASSYAGPFQFAALRTVFGTIALFAILILRGRSLRLVAPGQTLLLGLLQTAGFTGLSQWALVTGGAGKTAVLAYTMPFWLLLLAWPMLGERVRGVQWLAVALAAAGLVLIVEPWRLATTLASEMLAVLSGLSWAASAIVAKRMRASVDVDLLSLTAWQLLLGSVVLVVVALLVPAPPLEIGVPLILAVAYTALLGTGLAWLLWMYVLDKLPAGLAGLGSLVIPAIGVLAAWLQLGERPHTSELLGMTLVAAALALLAVGGPRQDEAGRAATA
ncbi:MAG TPA: EamA family transporter [Casimicrobiaceae bacterium]|jgi:drug/metabolite transporter (DMT)-like permease|nr:EamA family transporter [Casimicrobiaceae bacterium]